jgi:hypothetical protein
VARATMARTGHQRRVREARATGSRRDATGGARAMAACTRGTRSRRDATGGHTGHKPPGGVQSTGHHRARMRGTGRLVARMGMGLGGAHTGHCV